MSEIRNTKAIVKVHTGKCPRTGTPRRISNQARHVPNHTKRISNQARHVPNRTSAAFFTLLFSATALLPAPAQASIAAQHITLAQPSATAQPFTVVLDAAHGGSETGTLLASQLLEKDLVLSLSIHLRSALTARGMRVVTTREGDTNPLPEARAAAANHAHAGACIVLHATASGSGVHLYTSSATVPASAPLPSTPAQTTVPGTLAHWSTATAPFATDSLKLASEVSTALASAALPFTLGRIRMEPVDAMRCPVIAMEVAPLHPVGAGNKESTARISDENYRNRIVDALAAALVQWRSEREHASTLAAGQAGENAR